MKFKMFMEKLNKWMYNLFRNILQYIKNKVTKECTKYSKIKTKDF